MYLKSRNSFLYLTATIGNLLTFTVGVAFAWASPMLPKLNGSIDPEENPLGRPATLLEESWIAALLPLGATFGPLLAGPTADKLGRKKTLLLLACPILVSFLILSFAKTVPLFLIARLIMGLGVGSIYSVLPMYLVEIAEDHNRGILTCLMGFFVTLGMLFAYAIGPLLSVQNFCWVCTVPLMIFGVGCALLNPESPQFLASINDQKNLKLNLMKLRCRKDIEDERLRITKMVEELRNNQGGLRDLLIFPVLRKSLGITLGLIVLQQLAGITAVVCYMQTIFDAAGSGLTPQLSVVIIAVVQVGVTVVTSSLVDVVGRRILLLVSTTGSCLSLTLLGGFFYLKNNNFQVDWISWLPVASLVLYVTAFNIGLGPVPWTITAELFPSNVKAMASTLTAVVCFATNFFITVFFPSISVFLGMDLTFWLFAVACVINTIFIYWALPETKGKSWREIQELL